MRELLHLDLLREGRSLLAFSGGVDSTALFHLLLEEGIDFDIAHVNYHTRPSSDDEERDAHSLAKRHNKRCFAHSCPLEGGNFEHRAREERYRFFGYLMGKHGYDYLLTAHQLNDRLEWLMMQLCRGAGLPELLGVRSHERREGLSILRPLLEWDRSSIEAYLAERNLSHHIDESNADERYTRNAFRHRFSTPLMREYRDAIRRSFRYLEEDSDTFIENMAFEQSGELYAAPMPVHLRSFVTGVDGQLKTIGYVMSHSEKEMLKKGKTTVVGRKYAIAVGRGYTFIAPYHPGTVMDKGFREECRIRGIDPKLRGYLYGAPEAMNLMRRLTDAPAPPRSG